MKIRKAVIAVAGYGTRFLPATKVVPKELLPIVDRPIVQYLVEELVQSGIRDIILVTRAGTQAIADQFDANPELEQFLHDTARADLLESVRAASSSANLAVVRQGRHLPYGNGSPLLAAKPFLDEGEPFVYLFGDDLVMSKIPGVRQLLDVYEQHQPAGVIAFQKVPRREICRYAAAQLKPGVTPPEVASLTEKPACRETPSTLAQLGRFVLPWRVIEILEELAPTVRRPQAELYLTYANNQLCREARVLAHAIQGRWLTTGDPLHYLTASIAYALQRQDLRKDLVAYLRGLKLPAPRTRAP